MPTSGNSLELLFSGDIKGISYTFEVLLASRGSTSFTVSAILRHNGVEMSLASTAFTASSTTFMPFTATVSGLDPAVQPGDVFLVGVRSTAGSAAAMLITSSHQTFVRIR